MEVKIKCSKCDERYDARVGQCPACGNIGGYMQEPMMKTVGNLQLHLEETLTHIESGNKYQIKEIQSGGLIALLTHSPLPETNALKGKRVYISNATIDQYNKVI